MSATNVRDFAFVLSDKFQVLRGKAGETELIYYHYADEKAQEIQKGIDKAKEEMVAEAYKEEVTTMR